jgi:hypothetical protein
MMRSIAIILALTFADAAQAQTYHLCNNETVSAKMSCEDFAAITDLSRYLIALRNLIQSNAPIGICEKDTGTTGYRGCVTIPQDKIQSILGPLIHDANQKLTDMLQ